MKVRYLDSTKTFLTLDSLISEIKGSGKIVTAALPAGIPVQGVAYILGGRSSISSLFALTPDGAFHGPQLYATYARLNKLTKHYTVIAIVSQGHTGSLGKHTKYWHEIVGGRTDPRKAISFSEISDAVWGAEQRIQAKVIDYMGLGDDDPEPEPVVVVPHARSYQAMAKRTFAGTSL